ncbi:MAG: hypothetical protein ACJ8AT_29365 [Hyalangium sp.]
MGRHVETYSATAFWRRRSESIEEWAGRAEIFFWLLVVGNVTSR